MSLIAHQLAADVPPLVDDLAAQPATALTHPIPQPAQTHYATLDRSRLERALLALEPPVGTEAGPLHLSCTHAAIVLSRTWDGMRLSTSVDLNTARNNLPRRGLTFEASEPFGALGGNGRLTLGYPHTSSRRIDLTVAPGAGHVIVAVGNAALAVPAHFPGPGAPAVAASGLRLRRASVRFAPVPTGEASGVPASGLIKVHTTAALVSREDTHRTEATVASLPLADLGRLLVCLSDLTDRLPRSDGRTRLAASEILCRFDDPAAPSAAPEDARYVGCLVLDGNPFAHVARYANAPIPDIAVEFMPLGLALELPCTHEVASAPSVVGPVLRTRAGHLPHFVEIRVPHATAQWACDTMSSGDRLVLGMADDGRVDLLLARFSEDVAFVVAPTVANPALDLDGFL